MCGRAPVCVSQFGGAENERKIERRFAFINGSGQRLRRAFVQTIADAESLDWSAAPCSLAAAVAKKAPGDSATCRRLAENRLGGLQ